MQFKPINTLTLFLIPLFFISLSTYSFAQGSKKEKYYTSFDQKWLAEIPIWVPGFRGQLAYGDYDFSSSKTKEEKEYERLDKSLGIEFYFVGRIATRFNKFWLNLDGFSGKVSSAFTYTSLKGTRENEIVDITVQGTIPRLVAGYSVWQNSNDNGFKIEAIPYLGFRYVSIYLNSKVFDLSEVIDVRPNWFEPVLGLYVPIELKRFKFELQSDFGSVKSKRSWVISNRYRYRISKLVDVQLGWNYMRLHFNDNIGSTSLESTINLSGPTAGVGFRF